MPSDCRSGHLGRAGSRKSHIYLLEILAEAKRSGAVLTLDVYGDGPCHRSPVRAAEDLGVANQVRFLGYRPDLHDHPLEDEAYVHSSRVEPMSLANIEAMAAGLSIVAGRVGGMLEVYRDGVEGRFWPP